MDFQACNNGAMTKQREMRTKGAYEFFGPYLYLTAQVQVKTSLGFWRTLERSRKAIKGHNTQAGLQEVRSMRLELAARHGFRSSLPRLVGASQ